MGVKVGANELLGLLVGLGLGKGVTVTCSTVIPNSRSVWAMSFFKFSIQSILSFVSTPSLMAASFRVGVRVRGIGLESLG